MRLQSRMYAIVKTGGKQYRVEEGQALLVERLPASDGDEVSLEPLLYVDGSTVVDSGDELGKVRVEARVVGHERGPKLRVVKFKPKRGYKRRTGHRQELTRLEVTGIKMGARRASGAKAGAEAATGSASGGSASEEGSASKAGSAQQTASQAAKRPAARKPRAPQASKTKEGGDGS